MSLTIVKQCECRDEDIPQIWVEIKCSTATAYIQPKVCPASLSANNGCFHYLLQCFLMDVFANTTCLQRKCSFYPSVSSHSCIFLHSCCRAICPWFDMKECVKDTIQCNTYREKHTTSISEKICGTFP